MEFTSGEIYYIKIPSEVTLFHLWYFCFSFGLHLSKTENWVFGSSFPSIWLPWILRILIDRKLELILIPSLRESQSSNMSGKGCDLSFWILSFISSSSCSNHLNVNKKLNNHSYFPCKSFYINNSVAKNNEFWTNTNTE